MMVSPGGPLPHPEAAAGAAQPASRRRDPGPGLPDPPPQRRRDPRRHRPAPLDRHRRQGELRRPRQPLRQADPGGRRRRAGAAAQARPRPGRDPGRGDDPPAHRPHLGDLRVPATRPSSSARPSGRRPRTGSQPTLNGYRRAHFDYAFDYRTVDFDRAGIDSYASFGRTFDLFGDGSIHLAFTPGHSAGHMSVICRLKQRRLRDRRRRDVHARPSSTATRRCRRGPSTPTTSAARCRSCGSSTLSSRTR